MAHAVVIRPMVLPVCPRGPAGTVRPRGVCRLDNCCPVAQSLSDRSLDRVILPNSGLPLAASSRQSVYQMISVRPLRHVASGSTSPGQSGKSVIAPALVLSCRCKPPRALSGEAGVAWASCKPQTPARSPRHVHRRCPLPGANAAARYHLTQQQRSVRWLDRHRCASLPFVAVDRCDQSRGQRRHVADLVARRS